MLANGPLKGTRNHVIQLQRQESALSALKSLQASARGSTGRGFELDDLVTHEKHGLGRVLLVEGDAAVVVDFAPMKVRITAPFARMIML